MTYFCAHFPQNDTDIDEPTKEHYLDAEEWCHIAFRRTRREVFLHKADRFARVARRYGWQTGKRVFEPSRGKAGRE